MLTSHATTQTTLPICRAKEQSRLECSKESQKCKKASMWEIVGGAFTVKPRRVVVPDARTQSTPEIKVRQNIRAALPSYQTHLMPLSEQPRTDQQSACPYYHPTYSALEPQTCAFQRNLPIGANPQHLAVPSHTRRNVVQCT